MLKFTTLRTVSWSLAFNAAFLFAVPHPKAPEGQLLFEATTGETGSEFQWMAQTAAFELGINEGQVNVRMPSNSSKAGNSNSQVRTSEVSNGPFANDGQTAASFQISLGNSRRWKELVGSGGKQVAGNGNRRSVRRFQYLRARSIYKGIDMLLSGNDRGLTLEFLVEPHADVNQIRIYYNGTHDVRVDSKTGDLIMTTAEGREIRQLRPIAYQRIGVERVQVMARYKVIGNGRASLVLAGHDEVFPLVIDPVVVMSRTTSGNTNRNVASAVDRQTPAAPSLNALRAATGGSQ